MTTHKEKTISQMFDGDAMTEEPVENYSKVSR